MVKKIIPCPPCIPSPPPPPPPPTFTTAPCCPNLFAPDTLYVQMILEQTLQGSCDCYTGNYTFQRDDTCDSRGVWAYPLCAHTTICGIANSQFWVECDPLGPYFTFNWKNFNNTVPRSSTPLTICSCDPLFIWFPRVHIPFYGPDPSIGPLCSGIFSVCVNTTGDFTNCFNCHCCLETLGTYPATVPLRVTITNSAGSCSCLLGTYELLPAAPSAWLSNPLTLCGTSLVFGVSCDPNVVNGWLFAIYQIGNPIPLSLTPMTLHGCLPFELELTSVLLSGPVPCSGSIIVSVGL